MHKYRIAVVGLGGVGGYYGGKLAQRFAHTSTHEVIFIARGEHATQISTHGLRLQLASGTETIHPDVVTDASEQLGPLDLVLFCTKSYGLAAAADKVADSIHAGTVVLPLLNGVEGIEYLFKRFPEAKVLWGCVYIISSIVAPGAVQVQGKYNRLVWGNPNLPVQVLQQVHALLQQASINQEQYAQVEEKVWEKFSFISPVASLTSLTGKGMGEVYTTPDLLQHLQGLMEELITVAAAKGVQLPENLVQQNLEVLQKLPPNATSSMQRDFAEQRLTELENLTGYIVRQAAELGVEAPMYKQVYQKLQKA